MSDHFNNLTPEEHELLTKIAEESSEVIKTICKIFLHGLESIEPKTQTTNREKLESELGDLMFFADAAADFKIINWAKVREAYDARMNRPEQYLHHVTIKNGD